MTSDYINGGPNEISRRILEIVGFKWPIVSCFKIFIIIPETPLGMLSLGHLLVLNDRLYQASNIYYYPGTRLGSEMLSLGHLLTCIVTPESLRDLLLKILSELPHRLRQPADPASKLWNYYSLWTEIIYWCWFLYLYLTGRVYLVYSKRSKSFYFASNYIFSKS